MSTPGSPGMASLDLLTFGDLSAAITVKRDRAKPAQRAGWQRLLDVVGGLSAGSTGDDLTTDRVWQLGRLTVSGYQGVQSANPLVVDFDPTPGVTVMHGPNGSGKSSLADALSTVLHGKPQDPLTSGTGGKAPLWEREHLGRDAAEASVIMTLSHDDQWLTVSCTLGGNDRVTSRGFDLRTGEGTSAVAGGENWTSAVIGHQPVISYSAVERRVQSAGTLGDFLEGLLAFGGCVTALEDAVDEAAGHAKEAQVRWKAALSAAESEVTTIDTERHIAGQDLPPIRWPAGPATDQLQWLTQHDLDVQGDPTSELPNDVVAVTTLAATAAAHALAALTEAQDTITAKLDVPLSALHSSAIHLDDPGDTCPVCSTRDVAWLTTLAASVEALSRLERQRDDVRAALEELTRAIEPDLRALLDAMASQPDAKEADPVRAAANRLAAAVHAGGHVASPGSRQAVGDLVVALTHGPFVAAAGVTIAAAARHHQWSLARRKAVDPFLRTWTSDGALASEDDSWKAAKKGLLDLKNGIRTERTEHLRTASGRAIHELLADAGIAVTSMSVTERVGNLVLSDGSGDVSLAMLSAGQRNALLLAPLLAQRGTSPFGFLVLDDPVHAFDAVRIDRLAARIAALAADRRVIVFTHDERLREHLAAVDPAVDLRTVRRDPATGEVSVEPSGSAWAMLLDDAAAAFKLSVDSGALNDAATDLVRSLCRMALDLAVRDTVLHREIDAGRDPAPALAALDECSTTKTRLEYVGQSVDSSLRLQAAVSAAQARVSPHLQGWNQAQHGNRVESPAAELEITDARQACQLLRDGR